MKRTGARTILSSAAIVAVSLMPLPALSQVAGADQGIFGDEEQMLQINQGQIRQFEEEKMQTQRDLQSEVARNAPYRLKVEKQIKELSGQKTAASQDKLKELQSWIDRDNAYRAHQQALIDKLTQAISRLETTQMQTSSNLQNDIVAMRQNVQDQKDAAKFDRMMKMNYFNELQSEMGAASWGRPPEDGTFNSVGGYGFMGGYGMGAFGRQSGGYGRW
ncbi:MAG: hypothetical protein IPM23_18640 [Candidatus Melainabacteria bacterium]|nr:hypothetical protein [Candidatus Melainabacteria bacterium]